MAIKQRALMKLDTTKTHILRAMCTGSKAALGEVCRDLTETRDLYREGLPHQNYAAYEEIYDGLILAVRKMMEDGEADVRGEALILCKELLEHLEKETEKETRFKKELVFLPYKASMWDSLESVWKAAYDDKEHCNAYVMPIPYADLNPDQSVAEWHCERDQFPKDVPTLDWQAIDLKAWHPDVIFYHNPYDNCNLVTSVESRYYSRNLKECADQLVYIPYFVLEEPCTEESVEHFVATPGVLNADKVIVQSEAMRERYINILTRVTNRPERSYWERRISGAGSPKIDKVLTSKKEDFDMPEKWRKLTEGRKVILYNTSLSAMLQNSDKVCDKLRYVFDVFRNRDDVALWWRPHPLMKATIHSMRPQIEEEYLSLEKQYIEEGWGIYDDTPDLHRAICWSDAYYGDESSVAELYRNTHKSVLLQRVPFTENACLDVFSESQSAVIVMGRLWLFSDYGNYLLEIDLSNKQLVNSYRLPQIIDKEYPCANMLSVDDMYIYVVPFNMSDLWRFDIREKVFISLDAGLSEYEKKLSCKFRSSFYFREKLYLIGDSIDGIIILSKEGKFIARYGGYHEILEKHRTDRARGYFSYSYAIRDNILYVPVFNSSFVMTFDLDEQNFEFYPILPSAKEGICSIECKKKCFILRDVSGRRICWEPQNGVDGITQDTVIRGVDKCIMPPVKIKGNVYYFSAHEEQVVVYSENEKKIREIPFNGRDCWDAMGYGKYKFILRNNENIYFQMCYDGKIYILDTGDFRINLIKIDWKEIIKTIKSEAMKNIYNEECMEERLSLRISDMVSLFPISKQIGKTCDSIGKKIYRLLWRTNG